MKRVTEVPNDAYCGNPHGTWQTRGGATFSVERCYEPVGGTRELRPHYRIVTPTFIMHVSVAAIRQFLHNQEAIPA